MPDQPIKRRQMHGPEFDMKFVLRTLKNTPRKGPIRVTSTHGNKNKVKKT